MSTYAIESAVNRVARDLESIKQVLIRSYQYEVERLNGCTDR